MSDELEVLRTVVASGDTSPEIELRYARMIMSHSPQERVAMCFEMSHAAREIVRRSLESAGVSPQEIGAALLRRFYEMDLTPEQLMDCGKRVRAAFGNGHGG